MSDDTSENTIDGTTEHLAAEDVVSTDDLDALVGGVRGVSAVVGEAPTSDRWGRNATFVERLGPINDFLFERWFRTQVEGVENIPDGGALLVANHAGALPPDALQIQWALHRMLDRDVYMMGDRVFSRLPFLSWLFRRAGGIEANAETARKLLGEEGYLGLVFPEGSEGTAKHMSERYRLARFGRGGFVRVAMDARVPVVPVAVLGASEAMPVLANMELLAKLLDIPYAPLAPLIWLPAKIRIRFLPALEVAAGPTDDHSAQVQAQVIRDLIQEGLLDMLARRRTVLLG